MKRRILPILMIALTLVLLVCAMTVSVSANDSTTPSVSIDKFNLVFEDNVYLKYAVKFDGVEDGSITADNIGMLYFSTPQENYVADNATYTSSVVGYTTINDVKYYTFEYRHITAKQMTDYVYSVAYIDVDGERYYSAPVKYSVLDYCYAKLGKTGVASDNEDFKTLLSMTLEQGAAAQKYFKYNTERLASDDYFLVEVIGGTLEDGFTKGLYNANETATLTAPEAESGFEFIGWKNSAGEVVSTDNPASLTAFAKNDTYTATYKETVKYSEGLEFTSNGDGTCYVSDIGTCTDTDIVIPPVSPDGEIVITIGDSAFSKCSSLTSVTIGNCVTHIGASAFSGCTGLTSVTIPDSVTSIDYYAFHYCSNLTSVNISDIAAWCNISFGNFGSNPLGYARNLYLNNELITELVIPDGVTYIPMYAFYYQSSITSVTIPDSVTSIGEDAFSYCLGLTSVTIPDNVTSIGDSAFDSCSGLTSITIPNSVTSIGSYAFDGCSNLTSVYITGIENWCNISFHNPSSNPLNYGGKLYLNNKIVTELVIPNSVESIGNYTFCDCTSITSVVIPDTVTSVGNCAFDNCDYLTSVIIGNNVTSIGWGAFSDCRYLTSVTIPNSVKFIDDYAFYSCNSLATIVIPDSVESIGEKVLASCNNLTSVTIGSSIANIGNQAFSLCYNLTNITVSEENTVYKSTNGDLYTKDGKTIIKYAIGKSDTIFTIPEGVTTIGNFAFANCTRLTSVIIPDSVTSIGEDAFNSCTSLTSVTIPDSVTSIGDYAFSWCDSLTSITIPDSVEFIGNGAFSNCRKLAEIYYTGSEEEWNAISIGSNNTYLTNATRYYYSETVPTTEGNFWHYVDGVPTVWPEYVAPVYSEGLEFTSNGDGTCYVSFIGTCADTDIVITPVSPDGDRVTSIGEAAFAECSSLTSVTIPDSVTSIGDLAFYYCTSLTSINVGTENEKYKSIDGNLYSKDGKTLVQYAIGKSDTTFIIPDSVTSIGERAFSKCSGLTSVTIPDSVTSIGNYAFRSCSSLTSVSIGNGVTSIGDRAFAECSSLTNVSIGNSVTSIGYAVFAYSGSFTSVIIPDSVTSIGDRAFYYCSNLTSVYYTGNKENWDAISILSDNTYLTNATRYYYSETAPTTEGNFWHYDENSDIVIW